MSVPAAVRRRLPVRASIGALVLAAVLGVALLPTGFFVVRAIREGGIGLSVLLDARQAGLFGRSLVVALTATGLAVVWAVPTARAIAYGSRRVSVAIESLVYLPLLLPNITIVLGWVHAIGPTGYVTAAWRSISGNTGSPFALYTPFGAGFVLSLAWFPCVAIPLARGLRVLDISSRRSARLTASAPRRWWTIDRPILMPYVLTGASLVFLLSFADYGVPSALMVNVFAVEVFSRLEEFGGAPQALGLCLTLLAVVVVVASGRYLFARAGVVEDRGERGAPPVMATGRASIVQRAIRIAPAGGVIALAIVVPLGFLCLRAGGPAAYVRAMKTAGAQILSSLEVAAWGVVLIAPIALVFALAYRASGRAVRAAADSGLLLLLMVPGAIVGLGVLALREAWLPDVLRHHPALVAYAAGCRYLAFPAFVLAASIRAIRPSLSRAAEVGGAGPLRVLVGVLLPLAAASIVSAVTLSFVLTMAELSAAVLVVPPGGMTLPVRLASLLHFGEEDVVAALCVMASGFVVGLVVLTGLVVRRTLRLEVGR